MKLSAYLGIIAACMATLAIGMHNLSGPPSAAVFLFVGLTISPYLCLAFMVKVVSGKAATVAVLAVTLLAVCFGIWAFVDALYIHPDAQSALVFVFVPLYQWAMLLVACLPVYFLNRWKK